VSDAVKAVAEQIGCVHKAGVVEQLTDLGLHYFGDLTVIVWIFMRYLPHEPSTIKNTFAFGRMGA
jgi:hypothetical protein